MDQDDRIVLRSLQQIVRDAGSARGRRVDWVYTDTPTGYWLARALEELNRRDDEATADEPQSVAVGGA